MNPVEDDLIRQAQRLPRTIEPDRDLWPGIEAALLNEGTDSSEQSTIVPFHSRRSRRSRWNGIGIAAGLLLAAALGFWLGDALDRCMSVPGRLGERRAPGAATRPDPTDLPNQMGCAASMSGCV